MIDTQFVEDLIRNAGDIALDHFLNVEPDIKDDDSYVTQADLAVQHFLRDALIRHAPQDGIIAEEDGLRRAPASGSRYWVIDPIDGTASFAAGLPVWGIAIGVVDAPDDGRPHPADGRPRPADGRPRPADGRPRPADGRPRPIAGFFYAPAIDDYFETTPDGHVLRNGIRVHMRTPRPFHKETAFFAASRMHRNYTLSSDYPGKLRILGSTLAHLAYVAGGNADGALIERVYIWDIAAGMAMLANNGGVVRYIDGSEVDLAPLLQGQRIPMPMLAGHPDTIAEFAKHIAYNGGE